MLTKIIRSLLFTIVAALTLQSSAYACDTNGIGFSIFFDEREGPTSLERYDRDTPHFIGEIIVHQQTELSIFKPASDIAFFAYVNSSQTHPEYVGTYINIMRADRGSTCRPHMAKDMRGHVAASLGQDDFGLPLLVLHSQAFKVIFK